MISTIEFFSVDKNANLQPIGKLVVDDQGEVAEAPEMVRSVWDARMRVFRGDKDKALDSLRDWSNGYVVSKEVTSRERRRNEPSR